MKIATLCRKDGKIILETDNDAIAQAATDTPQDVIVAPPPTGDAYAWAAAHYGHDLYPETLVRLEGRPPALGCGYRMSAGGGLQRQDVPSSGIAALRQIATELRTRHVAGCNGPSPTLVGFADRIEAAMCAPAPLRPFRDHPQYDDAAAEFRRERDKT